MKELEIELQPPNGSSYYPGMVVAGTVVCEANEPKSYKQIVVKLDGRGDVHWRERGRHSRHQISKESYVSSQAVLWDKDTTGHGGKFPTGVHRFNFSLQISAADIPPSFTGTYGSFHYKVEARIIREGLLSKDIVVHAPINVKNVVRIDRPELSQPVAMEIRKTPLFSSGPIVMTVRIPRTGFCIGHDTIPVEVTIENGTNRVIQQVSVNLEKEVSYFSNTDQYAEPINIQAIASQPVQPHNTFVFQPNPLLIPLDTPPTLRNSEIMNVNYFVKVTADVNWSVNPSGKLPIVIGNIPLGSQ